MTKPAPHKSDRHSGDGHSIKGETKRGVHDDRNRESLVRTIAIVGARTFASPLSMWSCIVFLVY